MAYIKEIPGKRGATFRIGWRDPNGKEKFRNLQKENPCLGMEA